MSSKEAAFLLSRSHGIREYLVAGGRSDHPISFRETVRHGKGSFVRLEHELGDLGVLLQINLFQEVVALICARS